MPYYLSVLIKHSIIPLRKVNTIPIIVIIIPNNIPSQLSWNKSRIQLIRPKNASTGKFLTFMGILMAVLTQERCISELSQRYL